MFRRRWQRPNRVRAMVAGGLVALAASAVPAVGADPLVGREAWLPRVVPAGLPAPANPIPPIAIIETWMDPRHPEMQGGWVALRRPGPVPEDGDFIGGVEWLERINHGTMVASVIGAPENGVGIQGMFPATPVWLYGTSGRCTDVAAATRQAVRDGARVINFSGGFEAAGACRQLRDAVGWAFGRGTLVVASAGNGRPGQKWTQPANDYHVLTVGALNAYDMPAAWSMQSNSLDIMAPGEGVTVACMPEFDTADGAADGYCEADGTSFSAPMVAAAAARVLADRPDLSADQLSRILTYSARDLGRSGWDRAYGYGALDLAAALAAPEPAMDALEPNEEFKWVNGGGGFKPDPALLGRRSRVSFRATLDLLKDPIDIYRVSVPAGRRARITVRPRSVGLNIGAFESWSSRRTRPSDLIARSVRPGMRTETITVAGAPNGRPFYLMVVGRGVKGQFAGSYDLTIQRVG